MASKENKKADCPNLPNYHSSEGSKPREEMDLFSQCQSNLHVINMATEYQQVIKEEMKKFSKLERAIAHKKNIQAERVSGMIDMTGQSPVWFIHSVQSLAGQLVQQAKAHCTSTEKLGKHCAEIQMFIDSHHKVMNSIHDTTSASTSTSPPRSQETPTSESRFQSPRKTTTSRQVVSPATSKLLLSPPPSSRSKKKDTVRAEGQEDTEENSEKSRRSFNQAIAAFEAIRKPRLTLSNRVEYLHMQQKTIANQLKVANSTMTGLTDSRNGKMQWTAQLKLEELRSRKDFLTTHKKQIAEEIEQASVELKKFDECNKNMLGDILNIFSKTKARYERLLQHSISLLRNAVGSDKAGAMSTDHTYFMKSNLWETFDERDGAGEEGKMKWDFGDSHLDHDTVTPNRKAALVTGETENFIGMAKGEGRNRQLDEKSPLAAMGKNDDLYHLPEYLVRDDFIREQNDRTCEMNKSENDLFASDGSDSCNCSMYSSNTNGGCVHTIDGETGDRMGCKNPEVKCENCRKLKGVSKENEMFPFDEDRTNNHDFEFMKKHLQPEETPSEMSEETPDLLLLYTRCRRPPYQRKCSATSLDDLSILGNVRRDFEKEKEEEEIHKYINKYLLKMGRPEARPFGKRDGLGQRLRSWPNVSVHEKSSRPMTFTMSKENTEKLKVFTLCHVDPSDNGMGARRPNTGDMVHSYNNECTRTVSRAAASGDTPACGGTNKVQTDELENKAHYFLKDRYNNELTSKNEDHNIAPQEEFIKSNSQAVSVRNEGLDRGRPQNLKREDDKFPQIQNSLPNHKPKTNSLYSCNEHQRGHQDGNTYTKVKAKQLLIESKPFSKSDLSQSTKSFMTLIAKETKTVRKNLNSALSSCGSNSDSESPSLTTSVTCSSLAPDFSYVGLALEEQSISGTHWRPKSNLTSSPRKRVRFNKEVHYSTDQEEVHYSNDQDDNEEEDGGGQREEEDEEEGDGGSQQEEETITDNPEDNLEGV